MRKLSRVIETLSTVGGYFSGCLVIIMIFLIMFEVFMRYALRCPPIIADEVSAYMYVVLSFIALAYAWKEKAHIRIEVLVSRLPQKLAKWLRLVTLVMALSYAFVASIVAYNFVLESYMRDLRSNTWLRVPLYLPEISLVIGFSLLSLMLIIEIIKAGTNISASK